MQTSTKIFSLAICVLIYFNCLAGESQFMTDITPERQKEFLIERDLGKAVMSWLADNNASAALECDKLIDSLLAVREPTSRTYFLEAQVAYLRQNPKKAISALEKAIEKYPDEKAPNISSPVKIVGRFWIAAIARHSGDFTQAQKMYESILNEPNTLEGKEIYTMISNLYLAEIYSDHLKSNKDALSKLRALENINISTGQRIQLYEFYKAWAKYAINEIEKGKEAAGKELISNPEVNIIPPIAVTYLRLSVISESPIAGCCERDASAELIFRTFYDRMIKSGNSSIDGALIRLAYGFEYQQKKDYSEAEKYYSQLFNKDTFLSPVAGIYLAQCKKSRNNTEEANKILEQVSRKYPGFTSVATQVRKSF